MDNSSKQLKKINLRLAQNSDYQIVVLEMITKWIASILELNIKKFIKKMKSLK